MNALLWRARAWPAPQRPSLVSRLDKLTSGLIVVAKTAAAHAALQRAMAAATREKDYLAVVYGRVNVARGEIDLRLATDPGDRRKVVASTTVGAESLTRFERLARVAAPRAGLSLLRCRLGPGARIRSACTSRRAAGRWSAIRCTASHDGRRLSIRCSPRAAGVSPAGAARVARRVHASDDARAGDDRSAGAGRPGTAGCGVARPLSGLRR